MTTAIVNVLGFALMAAVIWWFWFAGRRRAIAPVEGQVAIRVAHGAYAPDRITINAGESVRFQFTREDPSPCAEIVQFEGLSISRELPLNEPTDLSIRYDEPGEYAFTCQMGMYRGHIVVK